ncbi:MAG: serine/threonine protein kinase [Deltaproteobacteria bacterium]|nr:serine/threonine protein kinase [Deltaproteobacteria bacterium]
MTPRNVSPDGGSSKSAPFGPFEIISRIGEGGMCHVFRAVHLEQGYECALKLLKEEHRTDDRIRELFLTEADVALLLHHPNLISTYDAGEIQGRYYIAMELIEGSTLGQLVERVQALGTQLPIDLGLFVISEILEGLHALHSASSKTGRPLGLIHRDVTPHNIFLSFDGRVLLGDFGVAHVQAYGEMEREAFLGKISYLAPELILGEESDHRIDLFAIGVVLHELLTGQRLYGEGTDEKIMQAIVQDDVPRPRRLNADIPKTVETVVLKALSKRAKDRHPTAEDLLFELEPLWSKVVGNPYALAAVMSATFRNEVSQWRQRGRAPSGLYPAVPRPGA